MANARHEPILPAILKGTTLPALTATRSKLTYLALLLLATITLPYLVPVRPSVGLSYVTGFNTTAAVLIFAFGSIAFAFLTRGNIGEENSSEQDRTLSRISFILGLLYVALLAWTQLYNGIPHRFGTESFYNLNRLHMLAKGLRPYRDFEYAYGPLLLYVPYLLGRAFHLPWITAYYITWLASWLLGTSMLWFILRRLPGTLRWRDLVFWIYLIFLTQMMKTEGIAYTPVRMIGSAFALLLVHTIWQRSRNAFLTAITAVAVVAFSLGISPEQGFGVFLGLAGWFLVLFFRQRHAFPVMALLAFLLPSIACFLIAARAHLFATLMQFSGGAYCFPLTPSIPIAFLLFGYVLAPCAAFTALEKHQYDSAAIPLTIGGFALLPAAFGRCDLGHLAIAAPALLLGIAYALSHRRGLHFCFNALTAAAIIPPLAGLTFSIPREINATRRVYLSREPAALDQTRLSAIQTQLVAASWSDAVATRTPQFTTPCLQRYRSPILGPPSSGVTDSCIDYTYYDATLNVFTPKAMTRVVQDLDRSPRLPIILLDIPLSENFRTAETEPLYLVGLQNALYTPPARNPPLSYDIIINYIASNYIPDASASNGLRIWHPKSVN